MTTSVQEYIIVASAMKMSPFTRMVEDEKKRKHYIPCVSVVYFDEDETNRSFIIGGHYEREADAYNAAISVLVALQYICDPALHEQDLPALVRLTLAEVVVPESMPSTRVVIPR